MENVIKMWINICIRHKTVDNQCISKNSIYYLWISIVDNKIGKKSQIYVRIKI